MVVSWLSYEEVAKDKGAVEDILRIVLHDPCLVVKEVNTQFSIKNLYGKSVRLDTVCITGDGRTINVELQKENNDDHVRRVRYNAACLTTNVSTAGKDYMDVNDVYVVYIFNYRFNSI